MSTNGKKKKEKEYSSMHLKFQTQKRHIKPRNSSVISLTIHSHPNCGNNTQTHTKKKKTEHSHTDPVTHLINNLCYLD
jgi:hypothetical protein